MTVSARHILEQFEKKGRWNSIRLLVRSSVSGTHAKVYGMYQRLPHLALVTSLTLSNGVITHFSPPLAPVELVPRKVHRKNPKIFDPRSMDVIRRAVPGLADKHLFWTANGESHRIYGFKGLSIVFLGSFFEPEGQGIGSLELENVNHKDLDPISRGRTYWKN